MRRVRFLVWKELIELRRDPRLLAVVIVTPMVQLILLGYAATTDVRNVPLVIADADRSRASRELVQRFDASKSFTLVSVVTDAGEAGDYLENGRARMALAIPPGFGERLAGGRVETIQLLADGSDANSAGVALGYANSLLAAYARELAQSGGTLPGTIEGRVRVWFNPRLESRDFMIPGIIALLLLVVTTILSSMAIVRERELGTLEQLNVTPLSRLELIVGKLVPYGMIGLIDVGLVLMVSTYWFHVPLRGSAFLLFGMTMVYLTTTLGLGLFVSTVSATQQRAMMTTTFMLLMPMIYLSGFVFPIENMPEWIQPITYAIPLRYCLVILRSLFLKGVGLETFWPQALALLAWGLGILALALARSSKRAA
ncbi:MAG: ABC transporter permease [Acidimicrobiia bacterium]|nr:ABC transporter permease [Acidimicrobiia bacterium]